MSIYKLFTGIVQYTQSLANTDNLVVKNQYAQLFGLTMSDMTALLQMGDDLSYVIEQELDYADAIRETEKSAVTFDLVRQERILIMLITSDFSA